MDFISIFDVASFFSPYVYSRLFCFAFYCYYCNIERGGVSTRRRRRRMTLLFGGGFGAPIDDFCRLAESPWVLFSFCFKREGGRGVEDLILLRFKFAQ